MLRRTKIVATLGPATNSPEMIEKLVKAGANVVRLNFSHGSPEDHMQRAALVREKAEQNGRPVALLADLQGPKIRISRFRESKVTLKLGQKFILDAQLGYEDGDENQVGIDYKALIADSSPGNILLLDDGRIELEVTEVNDYQVICKVIVAGVLSNNKGINRQGGGLSAKALTDKDRADIKTAAAMKVDYVAVSFPRDASDMQEARRLLTEAGSNAALIAKVERAEAVESDEVLDGIIMASEGVMVARGDLGVEIGDARLMGVQKNIIERARILDRVVITATQMMESMIESPLPTRAEVFDIANAVLDGTDAVMLSAETAAGNYPIETIRAVHRVCKGAEKHPLAHQSKHRLHERVDKVDASIAMSTMYAANHLNGAKAIISMTESGATPLLMSRIRSSLPVFAFSRKRDTQSRVALYRGVYSIPFASDQIPQKEINCQAVAELQQRGFVTDGDLVILTEGDQLNQQGATNIMKIIRVGEPIC